jgi:hypothetical protein
MNRITIFKNLKFLVDFIAFLFNLRLIEEEKSVPPFTAIILGSAFG